MLFSIKSLISRRLRAAALVTAACAVLTMPGFAGADEVAPLAVPAASPQPPALMAEAPARRPLMQLLDNVGIAEPLEDAGFTIGGRIQGSYTYSFSNPPDDNISGRLFDFENEDPTLNQIGLFLDRQVAQDKFDIGGRMEWIYGADSRLIHSFGLFDYMGVDSGPDNQWDLNQLYLDINVPNVAKFRVGKFVTPIGYELIDPTGNDFYSHSFLFNFAIPFTHTGVTATFELNDKIGVMVGMTRGWDTSLEDDNDAVDFLGQVAYEFPDGNAKMFLTLITGPDQPGDNGNWRTLADFIYTRTLGDDVKFALNADYGYQNDSPTTGGDSVHWFGVAAYLGKELVKDTVTLNTRLEYFNDEDGARLTGGVGGTSLYGATAGLSIRPLPHDSIGQYLVIRPEIRLDYAQEEFFDGGTDRYQVTAAIDAIFSF